MKISNLSKLIGASVLAASVAVVPFNLPASAQTDTAPGNTTTTTGTTQDVATERDTGFDWGWLGLLGLGGLAGLAGRKRPEEVRYRTDDEVRTTNYR
jgi:MYXO-CTERM domain-containing protein